MIKNTLPATTKRVANNTDPEINQQIRDLTIGNLTPFFEDVSGCGEIISDRINDLDYEWDTERFLETTASALVILGSLWGLRSHNYWCLLTGTVGTFLMLHALEGWCPPVPAIRDLGIRTAEEINKEKTALKILRGDLSANYQNLEELLTLIEKA